MAARISLRARKEKLAKARRAKPGLASAPLDKGFMYYKDYVRIEVDKKEIAGIIRNYIRNSFSKDEAKIYLNQSDYMYYLHTHVAATIAWKNHDLPFPDTWRSEMVMTRYFETLMNQHKAKEAMADIPQPKSVSPMKILQYKTQDMLGYIDEIIDVTYANAMSATKLGRVRTNPSDGLSLYQHFQKEGTAFNTAKAVYLRLAPLVDEMNETVARKCDQLNQAYGYLTTKQQKSIAEDLNVFLTDTQRYMNNKKAVRRVSAPKIKTADKQISKLKFLKQSKEFMIDSINPLQIIGASRLFAFNTKYKTLTEYVTMDPKGFEVRGTTITNIADTSRQKTLRKPQDILPLIQSKGLKDINACWNTLTTKESTPNGRINEHTILIKTFG